MVVSGRKFNLVFTLGCLQFRVLLKITSHYEKRGIRINFQ